MNNYLVLYDNRHYANIHAKNLEDCIVVFAKYTGDNNGLFLKALQGCHSPKDYADMYEKFSQTRIDSILLVEKTIYERGVINERA